MKMNVKLFIIKNKAFVLLAAMLSMALQAWGQVQVSQSLDSMEIPIGEQTQLHLTIQMPQGSHAILPSYKQGQQMVPGIEVLAQKDHDTTMIGNGLVEVGRDYILTSFDENVYALPAPKVKVDGKLYQGNPLALKVLTVAVDTVHPNQYYPPKDVQDNPFEWSEWRPMAFMSLIVLLLSLAAFYLITRLKAGKPIITHIRMVRRVPAHTKALNEIDRIKHDHVDAEEGPKAYYTRLTDTLRQYIQSRFEFNAMEMTSDEIINHLQKNADKEMIDELRELFRTADLVKFAKYETLLNENDKNLVSAVKFIDETKTDEVEHEERVTPSLTLDDQKAQRARRQVEVALAVTCICAATLLGFVIYRVATLLM